MNSRAGDTLVFLSVVIVSEMVCVNKSSLVSRSSYYVSRWSCSFHNGSRYPSLHPQPSGILVSLTPFVTHHRCSFLVCFHPPLLNFSFVFLLLFFVSLVRFSFFVYGDFFKDGSEGFFPIAECRVFR